MRIPYNRLLSLLTLLVFLGVWSWSAMIIANKVVLPSVSEVADILFQPTENLLSMGSLITNVLISLLRVLLGYLVAVVIAIPLGVAMGYYDLVHTMFGDFLNIFRPIPPLAWVPLVMAWFGIASLADLFMVDRGTWFIYLNNFKFSMIFIIFIGAFYPILTSSIHGVRNVNRVFIDAARVLGANEFDIFRKILLPAALPSMVNGMRIGLGVAWMCLVSAEMLPGSISGIGYLITHAYTLAATDIVIAGMVSIGVTGAFMDWLFRSVERRYFAWQRLAR
ncbi:MAG: ABC transporter permease [Desulfomicrobium sp.]|nr:ABC transporter permease [Desulfomicrobium sp.]NLV97917.1 ABC transporter permease [Desulfovibrionales bacterium]